MDTKQELKDLHELVSQLERRTWDLYRSLDYHAEPVACSEPPKPLTKQELMDLMADEVWIDEGKNMGWVQPVGFNFVIPALLDVWEREIVAVTSAMRDGSDWYWIRDYGKTWVAYLDKPVFDNE